jgi:AraC-like DNA-binding protein
MSFLPGETLVDDLSVMKFNGQIEKFLPENYVMPCYTIQIVTSGSLNISVNNKEYDVRTNDGYFLSPNFFMKSSSAPSEYAEMYILSFSRKFAKEMKMTFKLEQIAQVYAKPVWSMPEKKVQRLIHYFELLREVVDDKNREAALHLVYSIFEYLAGGTQFDKQVNPSITREEKMAGQFLALVDENCEQQHSLDWYASEMCLSTRYVANTVKQVLKMTASSCIENALMQRAKTLLHTTNKSVQEIAEQLGFQNQSHFGTFFKRHEGLSPVAYRKK